MSRIDEPVAIFYTMEGLECYKNFIKSKAVLEAAELAQKIADHGVDRSVSECKAQGCEIVAKHLLNLSNELDKKARGDFSITNFRDIRK